MQPSLSVILSVVFLSFLLDHYSTRQGGDRRHFLAFRALCVFLRPFHVVDDEDDDGVSKLDACLCLQRRALLGV